MRTELQPLGKYHWSGKRQVRSPLNWDHYGQVTQPHRKCEWSGKRQVRSLNWDHLSQWQVAQAHSEHQLKEKTSYIHRRLQATSNITTWKASCLRNATIFTLDAPPVRLRWPEWQAQCASSGGRRFPWAKPGWGWGRMPGGHHDIASRVPGPATQWSNIQHTDYFSHSHLFRNRTEQSRNCNGQSV